MFRNEVQRGLCLPDRQPGLIDRSRRARKGQSSVLRGTASGTQSSASRGKLKLLGISSERGNAKPAGITPTTV